MSNGNERSGNSLAAILDLIVTGVRVGGDIAPIALRALAALRRDYSDEELTTVARELNAMDAQKIVELLIRTEPDA